jgi:hypothetical protein
MRDALGNTIRDGDLLVWNISAEQLRNMVFQVLKVQDGAIDTPQGKTPGVLILAITLPVPKPSEELMDFKCLRNPESESLIETVGNMRRH